MTAAPVAKTSRAQRIAAAVRARGIRVVARQYLRRKGIHVTTFYYVKEAPPNSIAPELTTLPDGFTFGILDADDIDVVATFPARGATFTVSHVRDSVRRGHTCIGVKRDGEIVGFTWFALDASHSNLHAVAMAPNEAYLFNIYMLPEIRGHNIASILRFKTYELLQQMGRDTFYSISVTSNRASWRFKEKLGAQKLFLGLAINLFGKFQRCWTLRRY